MRLVIYSDVICPWCFIAKRHLDAALTRLGHPPINIRFRPYQLYPDMPSGGVPAAAVVQSRFAGTAGDLKQVAEAGARMGIHFDFDALTTVPNSLPAHALIACSAVLGNQYSLVESLFCAFFEQGRDIGRHEVLVDVAADVGMDWSDSNRVLESAGLQREIKTQADAARESGIRGVPTFVLDGKTALQGAQPIEVLVDFLARGAIHSTPGDPDAEQLTIH